MKQGRRRRAALDATAEAASAVALLAERAERSPLHTSREVCGHPAVRQAVVRAIALAPVASVQAAFYARWGYRNGSHGCIEAESCSEHTGYFNTNKNGLRNRYDFKMDIKIYMSNRI